MKKIGIVAAVLSAPLVLSACSLTKGTPYQELTLLNTGGVSHSKGDDGVYSVKGRGNGFTTTRTVIDYMYLRASEVVREEGATCFAIVDETHSLGHTAVGYNSISYPKTNLKFVIQDDQTPCPDRDANSIYESYAPIYIKGDKK